MVNLFYTTYISVDLAHQVIFHAKVGKGGINGVNSSIPVVSMHFQSWWKTVWILIRHLIWIYSAFRKGPIRVEQEKG